MAKNVLSPKTRRILSKKMKEMWAAKKASGHNGRLSKSNAIDKAIGDAPTPDKAAEQGLDTIESLMTHIKQLEDDLVYAKKLLAQRLEALGLQRIDINHENNKVA